MPSTSQKSQLSHSSYEHLPVLCITHTIFLSIIYVYNDIVFVIALSDIWNKVYIVSLIRLAQS